MTEARGTERLAYRLGAALLALATLVLAAPPAHAEIYYPWCAQYGSGNNASNCGFSTLEQCRWAISGNGGSCYENPFYLAEKKPARPSRRHLND